MIAPPQYFQSVIAIELAITGALLWQIRYFERPSQGVTAHRGSPSPTLRLLVAAILAATIFGSLWGILHEGGRGPAIAVTIGLSLSLLPILLRVLPPLARDAASHERDPHAAVTIVGLVLYAAVVAAFVILLNA